MHRSFEAEMVSHMKWKQASRPGAEEGDRKELNTIVKQGRTEDLGLER